MKGREEISLFNTRREVVSSPMVQYYDINKTLLTIVGLWPYQRWRSRIIQITLILGLLVSFLIVQLATFVTLNLDVNVIIQILSQLLPCVLYILKYNSFLMNRTQIKHMIERIHDEWTILKVPGEVDILRKYARLSKLFTLFITVLGCIGLMIYVLFQFLPKFLDVIAPLNESRDCQFPFLVEHFVDQKRYFYPILMHGLTAICIGCIAAIAISGMIMGCALHICAQLKIASRRLEHINDKVPLLSAFEKDRIIRKRIISAVDIHRRAIGFSECFVSNFMVFFFLLMVVGIASLTINMFQVFQYSLSTDDINKVNGMVSSGLLVIVYFVYIFVANLGGQIITDHNTDIFNKVCAVKWYAISVQMQKLLFMVLQKNTKNYCFILGGIFTASLEGFATLTSMSISYFTVIYSMR